MAQKAKASRGKKPARRRAAARARGSAASGRARARRTARKVGPVPPGYHTVTPHLMQDDCAAALAFYAKAFGARERLRMPGPGGKIIHAEMQVGDSFVMMGDEMASMPGEVGVYKSPRSAGCATAGLMLYVKNVDAVFARAVAAGCTVKMAPADMFWGDRFGSVIDPFGHTWSLATHKEDLTPKQMKQRQAAMSQG